MSAVPILLAGTVGAGAQNHQAEMWAPNLARAGLSVEGVWTPPTVGDDAIRRAADLAAAHAVELQISDLPVTAAAGAIVCLRGDERIAFAAFAAERGMPILLDKPTLDTTAEIHAFASAIGSTAVLPGHHFTSHPGFTRVLSSVRNAEFGLLRAVHADLVTGGGEPSDIGELRNLGVHLIELIRLLTGPAIVDLQAHRDPIGAAWSFLGKTDRGVVISHHVSRTSEHGATRQLRGQLRLTGTHGFVVLELLKPAIDVHTVAAATTVPYVEASVVAHLRKFAALSTGAGRSAPAADLVTLSTALDRIAESADAGDSISLTW